MLAGIVGGTAVGLRRTGIGRRWFVILSGALSIVLVVSSVSFARSGPFSPDVQQQVVMISIALWLLLSGRGTRRRD